jgi:hypothetical protein
MGAQFISPDCTAMHNAAMKRCLTALALALAASSALAWNAAGHRLVAAIAWRQMSPPAQAAAADLLARHPDYRKWVAKANDAPEYAAFLQASTWADDIRRDRRFHNERSEAPTPPLPGLADTARHKDWHYVDLGADGSVHGQLDRQLERLIRVLRSPATPAADKAYALPWLIHLVGDIHQPLHVGSRDDEGGNDFEIEDPFNPRRPFASLHAWWDDLPGPPWLRGARLERVADALLAAQARPPAQGGVARWREESRGIGRDQAYPSAAGSLLPIVTAEFRDQSRAIANQRLTAAGFRLGRLLDDILGKVSRETE